MRQNNILKRKINVININPMDKLNTEWRLLDNRKIPIVCIVRKPIEPESEILPRFTRIVGSMIKKFNSDGFGIVGGETAYHLLRRLKVNYLKICGNMSDVIAYGSIVDGIRHGCPITTKGGSTGHDDSLLQMVKYLKKNVIH